MNEIVKTETKRYQCRHIFTDGHRCGSICLRGEPFCYYHHTTRKPAPRQSLGKKSSFDLPLPEDRSAIQASIGIILQKIASNDLDPKRAGLLLYGLQIASLNLPKQQPQRDEDALEQVQEITTDPELGTLAPQSEIHEKKSSIALLLEEFTNPKPATLPLGLAQEPVRLVVAGGKVDTGNGGSGLEECFDGFGCAAVLPVGVGAGFDGEGERAAALAIEGIDGSSAGDEGFDGGRPASPGGYVESGAIAGDVEVTIAAIEGCGADAEVEQGVDAFYVGVAGELGEQGSALRQ